MLLLVYKNGSAFTLSGDLTEEHLQEFDNGVLDVFDLSLPVARLAADYSWDLINENET